MTSLLRIRKTFISRQIMPVTMLALLSCASDYASSIISTLVVGGGFGEIGLVIVGITAPIETFRLFICDLLCGSSVYLRSVSISEGNKDKGARMVGCALILILTIGFVLFFGMSFGAELYVSFFDLSEETSALAVQYVRTMALTPLVSMVMYFCYEFVFRLGEELAAAGMIIFCSLGVAGLGMYFVNLFGLIGMAYACVIGNGITAIIGIITLLPHRKEISFKFSFKKDEMIELLRYGFSYSQDTFYYPVYSAAINMFLGRSLGESAIAVFAIIECVSELCSVFYGVSYAAENQLSIYVGEKNTNGIKKSLAASLSIQAIIAVISTALVLIFARPIAVYMGMSELYAKETIFAIRMYASGFIFLAWLCYNSDFYCAIERTAACISLYFSKTIIAGIVITIALGLLFGSTGVYIGKALEAPFALLITYFVTRKVYKTKSMYMMPEDDSNIASFDYDLSEKEIMETRDSLEQLLVSKGVDNSLKMKILLAYEECTMLAKENNKSKIYGECTVFFKDDAIEMILRDNGKLYDIADTDNDMSSFRSYIVSTMVLHYKNTSHINASNTNRTILRFPI